jgi:hypothetical protein
MTRLYRIVCEWDIGHENIVFSSRADAKAWADEALAQAGLDMSVAEVWEQHLASIERVTLWGSEARPATTYDDSRSYTDGRPYYCKACGSGWGEYLACESACELESTADAEARRAAWLEAQGQQGTRPHKSPRG